jgi:hypothetical protein
MLVRIVGVGVRNVGVGRVRVRIGVRNLGVRRVRVRGNAGQK